MVTLTTSSFVFWRVGSPRSSFQQIGYLVRTCFLVHRWPPTSCILTWKTALTYEVALTGGRLKKQYLFLKGGRNDHEAWWSQRYQEEGGSCWWTQWYWFQEEAAKATGSIRTSRSGHGVQGMVIFLTFHVSRMCSNERIWYQESHD
ncbi:hypothetical protein mRhiFer1_008039 [Rhinolophus ferrumequinum]|uniref:Uncharacterized protein n=1 Tax=Rhinolophus ferrumequinum TaxID=59479 RepID=A0A7J7WQY8_RHIFE|nr:hypothetical protein mRhiFer1_008039 [Rhinolophus ferrumequinum]